MNTKNPAVILGVKIKLFYTAETFAKRFEWKARCARSSFATGFDFVFVHGTVIDAAPM